MDKKFLTAEEAIAHFGLDSAQFQQLVDDGELRALADRGTWKYRRDEIEGLIQRGLLTSPGTGSEEIADDDGPQTLVFEAPALGAGPDDFSFLELDEEALAEGATTIKKSSDLEPVEESFGDMLGTPVEQSGESSSEVTLVGESNPEIETPAAAADLPYAESLSELEIVIADSSAVSASPPVILHTETAAVPGTDSDVKVVGDVADPNGAKHGATTDHIVIVDDSVITPAQSLRGLSASDSDVRIADSGISLEAALSDLAPDSGLSLASSDIHHGDSNVRIPDSGISLEATDSGFSLEGDSGLTLESSTLDRGLTLTPQDSGIALDSLGDSGISLEHDSGLSLEQDSGLTLDGPESGISLGRKSRARSGLEETQPEFDPPAEEEFEWDHPDSNDQTATISLDDDDALETLPPTKRAAGKSPSLSETFDSVDEVEDLDIIDDLDAGELDVDAIDDEEVFEGDDLVEDVLDASDDAFSMSDEGGLSEDQLSAASVSIVKTVAREPSWGIVAVLPVAICAFMLVVQTLLLWDGMSTMWNGDTSKAVGVSVIDALGDVF